MKRITKFLTTLALLTGAATGAWADTVDLSTLTANYEAKKGDVLTGTLSAGVKITVASGATVTLSDATINGTDDSNCRWAGITCQGDATIVLSGTNTIRFHGYYSGIFIAKNKTLTIKGDGSLTAISNGYGAGIGSGLQGDCGNIVITGGTITATGGYGAAGIGGGYYGSCGNIRITGGTVTAKGGVAAPGIGGGRFDSCGNVAITDGVTSITATKGSDAPYSIGAAYEGTCGTVIIGGTEGAISTSPYTYTGNGTGVSTPIALTLSDSEDNSTTLSKYDGLVADVTLSGRTLYKDGSWNTLCLPFDLVVEGSALDGATARTLKSTSFSDGTLTLTFGDAVSTIEAGVPYIIKWNVVDLSTLTADYEAQDGDVLTGTLSAGVKVTVASGATVTLSDATINGTSDSSCRWAGITCQGDATIILSGTNTIRFHDYYSGIFIAKDKTLTIKGDGSLTAISNGYGAGIGSGLQGDCGNIVIKGGTITATGGYGAAGIGGGYYGSCGNISITGGTVTATGGVAAPGIGGGRFDSCGNVAITDGVTSVTATKGSAAPYSIGAAYDGTCGTVIIGGTEGAISTSPYTYTGNGTGGSSNSTIDLSALTADYEAQDGDVLSGTLSANVKITMASGATVTLRDATINGTNDSSYSWAGITCEGDATIILSGENTVKGFYEDYPGIFIASDKTLTIKGDGSLTASSNGYGAGIGGGYEIACGNIIIKGGTITATGGRFAAGIGGGGSASYGGGSASCGDITITGGTITATGGMFAPGIGGGRFDSCGNVAITDGVTRVTATKGSYAPYSIGAAYEGTCGTVIIGGTVTGSINESPYTYTGNGTGGSSDSGSTDLVNPVFEGVTISGTTANVSTTYADFVGSFSPVSISGEDKTMLYLGGDNTVYYPNAAMTIGSCRAYFQLNEGLFGGEPASAGVRAFVLNFGDDKTTGIEAIQNSKSTIQDKADAWYDLGGRRLTGQPTAKGIYIKNGKKVFVK